MPKLGGSYTPDCIAIFSSGEHLPHNFEILRNDLVRNGVGYMYAETCFCVHTLTSNPYNWCMSYNTAGVKLTNH